MVVVVSMPAGFRRHLVGITPRAGSLLCYHLVGFVRLVVRWTFSLTSRLIVFK